MGKKVTACGSTFILANITIDQYGEMEVHTYHVFFFVAIVRLCELILRSSTAALRTDAFDMYVSVMNQRGRVTTLRDDGVAN